MEFSGINITQILVTLISTIGAVICAVVGRKAEGLVREEKKVEKPPLSKWALGMWACVAIAVINTGLLAWRLLYPGPATNVTITYPINLARVDQTETVRGTVHGLLGEQVVWVVVFAQGVGRYYPQNRPADIEADNKWSSIVYIGVPADTDKRFDILAVVVDSEAQNAFDAYLADARDRNDWAGLEALPAGAVIHDRITVTRK
jgi:hypothetical protein